jgi:hypothetical protein
MEHANPIQETSAHGVVPEPQRLNGDVAELANAPVLKTGEGETPSEFESRRLRHFFWKSVANGKPTVC